MDDKASFGKGKAVNLLTRSVLMGVVLVLAISGFRWFPPLMMLFNPFPLLLFFLVSKRERYGFLVLGSIAGLFAFLVSSGPGSFWVLQYVSEAWFISRLVNMLTRPTWAIVNPVWSGTGTWGGRT